MNLGLHTAELNMFKTYKCETNLQVVHDPETEYASFCQSDWAQVGYIQRKCIYLYKGPPISYKTSLSCLNNTKFYLNVYTNIFAVKTTKGR